MSSTWGPDSTRADVQAKLFQMMKAKFKRKTVTGKTLMDALRHDVLDQIDFDLTMVEEFEIETEEGNTLTISDTAGGYVDWVMAKLKLKKAA